MKYYMPNWNKFKYTQIYERFSEYIYCKRMFDNFHKEIPCKFLLKYRHTQICGAKGIAKNVPNPALAPPKVVIVVVLYLQSVKLCTRVYVSVSLLVSTSVVPKILAFESLFSEIQLVHLPKVFLILFFSSPLNAELTKKICHCRKIPKNVAVLFGHCWVYLQLFNANQAGYVIK